MHPVLFTIPLPATKVPLYPGLVALALVGLVLFVYGQTAKRPGLPVFGAALLAVASYAAYLLREETLLLAPLPVPAWGTLVGLWLVATWYLTTKAARQLELDRTSVENAFVVSALAGLLGARGLFLVVTLGSPAASDPLALRQGGLLGFGAVLGAIASATLFLRGKSLSVWQWLDLSAPSLCLGVILIRLGCYLQGCDFGTPLPASAPDWLAELGRFPRWADPDHEPVSGALAWLQQVELGSLGAEQAWALPVHPVQLYELGLGGLLLGLALYLAPRRSFHGQTGLAVLFAYAYGRFVLEALRGDALRGEFGPLLQARVSLSVGLLLLATAYAYGPALAIKRARLRYLSIAATTLPALAGLALTWGSQTPARQLSASAWLALLTAAGTSYVWSTREQLAPRQPPAPRVP